MPHLPLSGLASQMLSAMGLRITWVGYLKVLQANRTKTSGVTGSINETCTDRTQKETRYSWAFKTITILCRTAQVLVLQMSESVDYYLYLKMIQHSH